MSQISITFLSLIIARKYSFINSTEAALQHWQAHHQYQSNMGRCFIEQLFC